MATSNFYQGGNNGLNVIAIDYEEAVTDTMDNIEAELKASGYKVYEDGYLCQAPRSFETGIGYLVSRKDGKTVAFMEICNGYYEGANIDVYTGDKLKDINDDYTEITKNKRDVSRVMKIIEEFTEGYKKVAQFSNGETIYEKGK